MDDYIIATSSTSDLPSTWLERHQVPFISYTYTVGDDLFMDDCKEETREEVYHNMRNGALLKTSMINEYLYLDFFKSILDTGKNVIFLDMSQKMSISYEKSKIAADMARQEYPNQKFYLMDTVCVSGGLGTLVEAMVQKKESGASYEEVIAWGEENKLKIAHRFTVDDLKYLKAGGRVSNAAALIGSMLNIKPVLYVPDEGTLEVAQKVRGRKTALKNIIDGVLGDLSHIDPKNTPVHILHADCMEDANYVKNAIREAYPSIGEITITGLGVVIGAHCGPGLLAVFYFCDKRCP